MIKTDKIVTLSYGTFSCSMQGFDDKFDILEPIADYFRDLLIDEGQDGGKLPTPDADVLARLVGDVIAHPVEGYEAQGMIVLKPIAVRDDKATADEDTGNMDETPDPESVAADPAQGDALGDEGLSEAVNGNGQTLEETLTAISDILPATDKPATDKMEKTPEPGVELADEDNIFVIESADGDVAVDDDPTPESDTPESDVGVKGNTFEEDKPVGEVHTAPEATGSERGEDAPNPVVRPSRMARVIRMKRADFDAAISSGVIEEDLDEPVEAAEDIGTQRQGQGLSKESEADLQRQLAKAEEVPTGQDGGIKPNKPKAMGRRKGVDRLQSSERRSDLERIFDEADSQMGKPDTSERRSALQHLRAAVSATRAEKSVGHELGRNIDEAPYRTDLAQAVDAPTDVSKKNWARRKNTSVLPPLKLVIDQRVDVDKI